MKLSKEDFVKYIEALEESKKIYYEYGSILSVNLVEKLCVAFEDAGNILSSSVFTEIESEYINWFIWESCPDNRIIRDGRTTYDASDAQGLYELLKTFENHERHNKLSQKLKETVARSKAGQNVNVDTTRCSSDQDLDFVGDTW